MLESVLASDWYTWGIIPILIFLARIVDVSLGTIRVIFIAKGYRFWAPFLGFFEVLIWLMAIRQVITSMEGVLAFLAYAAGFAAGTYVGMRIEDKISLGNVLFRVVTGRDASRLITHLHNSGFRVTSVDAKTSEGRVHIIYAVIKRKSLRHIIRVVKAFNPHAFYAIEDVRFASAVDFDSPDIPKHRLRMFNFYRKSK